MRRGRGCSASKMRRSGGGIVYKSVRHTSGVNVVAYRPRKIRQIIQCEHYELTVPLTGKIVARRLAVNTGISRFAELSADRRRIG